MARSKGRQGCGQLQDGSCGGCCGGRSPVHSVRWPVYLASLCGCTVGFLAAVFASWGISWSQVAVGAEPAIPVHRVVNGLSAWATAQSEHGDHGAALPQAAPVAKVPADHIGTDLVVATRSPKTPSALSGSATPEHTATPSLPVGSGLLSAAPVEPATVGCAADASPACVEPSVAVVSAAQKFDLMPTAVWTLGGYHYVSVLDKQRRHHTLRLGASYGAWQLVAADLTTRQIEFRHADGQRWTATL